MLLSRQFLLWLILISETFAKLCPSADIRNSVSQLSQLSGCRIIEGFLQLVLIDSATEADYKNWTFPELREVTEYVIFYRVSGLRSVASLFPNLSVIRGEKLVQDYAFILSEMYDLTDISLTSLTIFRGSVALNKNPRFGYAETVDWDEIAPSGFTPFIYNNSRSRFEDCDRCPTKRCWSAESCLMKKELFTPDGKTLCDKQCVRGCSGPSPMNCTSCRKYALSVDNGTMCVGACPNGTYSFIARYCISYRDCLDTNSPYHKGLVPKSSKKPSRAEGFALDGWFVWNASCILECPPGHEKSPDGRSCQACKEGTCRKECRGALIETLADAQNLRECTHIQGSLEIQIQDKNPVVVGKELESSLGKVEQIDGYLKIIRSSSLTSLDFFKRLKFINGNFDIAIGSGTNYSFIVLDNQNLQTLFSWDTRPSGYSLRILRGRPFFHYNPRLCIKHINKMLEIAGIKNFSKIEVAPDSNGGQFPCSVFSLNVTVRQKYPTSIILAISRPQRTSVGHYQFMGYVVSYKPVESENLTTTYETDSCSESSWKIEDVLNDTEEYGVDFSGHTQYHKITSLEPNTLYAVHVKTYAVDSIGGESPIVYVQTLPSRPEMPRDFMAHSNSSSEVILRWTKPSRPNGVIEKYVVYGFIHEDDPNLVFQRNYCEFSLDPVVTSTPPPRLMTQVTTKGECSCHEESRKRQEQMEEDVCLASDPNLPKVPHLFNLKTCENYIYKVIDRYTVHDANFVARKSKRELSLLDDDVLGGRDSYVDGTLKTFLRTVAETPDQNTIAMTLTDLKHYSLYTITLATCRARHPEEQRSSMHRCSRKAILSVRTLPDPYADNIPDKIDVKVNNRTATLKWTPPPANGLTVAYHVEMTRADRVIGHPDCIPASETQGGYLTLHDLDDGRYRLRMRSISLAGLGVYSDFLFFEICDTCTRKTIIISSVVVVAVLVISLVFGLLYRWKRKLFAERVLIASVNPEYAGLPQTDSEWELPPENIKIIRELKRGNFGMVCEAILSPEGTTVAVKKAIETLNGRDVEEFLNEAMVMKQFTDCAHIVQLLGVVSRSVPQLVVMEMMAKGDLKSFLRETRKTNPPTPGQMLLMAAQIADGMAFLEESKFVHRDLAARNCMVSAENVVKIGDFGMTRDVYETDYYRKGNKGLLPVRWMSPESLNDGVFSTKSDVWSYGVVLWEISSLASQPYQGMSNEQVLQYVITGNRLELPVVYPKRFKLLTEWCWKWRPSYRPSFFDVLAELEEYTTASFRHVAYYYSQAGLEAVSSRMNNGTGNGRTGRERRRPTTVEGCTASPQAGSVTYANIRTNGAVS